MHKIISANIKKRSFQANCCTKSINFVSNAGAAVGSIVLFSTILGLDFVSRPLRASDAYT